MATRAAIAEVLRAVALGDEAATEALAQYLEQGQVAQGPTTAQQVEAYYKSKESFAAKVRAKSKEYGILDPNADPEGYAEATRYDALLAKRFPDMPEDVRLEKVAERVSAKMGVPEERDYSSAVATMRAARTAGGKHETETEIDFGEETDEQDEKSRYDSGIIAKMKRDRIALREGQRPGEPPRMARAFPFPTNED